MIARLAIWNATKVLEQPTTGVAVMREDLDSQNLTALVPKIKATCQQWIFRQLQNATAGDAIQLRRLHAALERILTYIESGILAGELNPWTPLKTDRYSEQRRRHNVPSLERPIRVGVLPLTANPLHWGHILMALAFIHELRLDTVIFLVQRRINYKSMKKRHRVPIRHRYQMIREGLADFYPLLRDTDVALRNNKVGEAAVHDLRRLNRRHRIDFICLWGGESEERTRRIMKQLADFSAGQTNLGDDFDHTLSAGFIERQQSKRLLTRRVLQQIQQETGMPFKCFLVQTSYQLPDGFSSTLLSPA